jgi:hypothetical protein
MNVKRFSLVAVLFIVGSVPAQERAEVPAKDAEAARARVQRILTETLINTKDLPLEMPLAKFLAALEAKLPEGKKVALSLDEKGLGKDLAAVAATSITFSAPLENVSVLTVLRRGLKQVNDVEYALQPGRLLVTRPKLAVHTVEYDVGLIVREMPLLLPGLRRQSPETYRDLQSGDGMAIVVRAVANFVELRPWETLEAYNGTQLMVVATPRAHAEIADLLESLRRLTDLGVVMNARLYAVDRAFYTKQVGPLFPRDKETGQAPAVVAIDGPLFQAITGQKFLHEGTNTPLRPGRETDFLARQSAYQFAAEPKQVGTGLAGVSFRALAQVSADRRFLRLTLTQQVAQFVAIDKTRRLDLWTGQEIEVEVPNVHRKTLTGTVQIPDAGAILMPVAYRPPGPENADKVWLLVARPFIWIEEEVKAIRQGGGDVTPKDIWNTEVPKEEEPEPAPRFGERGASAP